MDRDEKLKRFIQMWKEFEDEMNKEDTEDDLRIGGMIGSTGEYPSEPSDK